MAKRKATAAPVNEFDVKIIAGLAAEVKELDAATQGDDTHEEFETLQETLDSLQSIFGLEKYVVGMDDLMAIADALDGEDAAAVAETYRAILKNNLMRDDLPKVPKRVKAKR
jgi:hypothetical protein